MDPDSDTERSPLLRQPIRDDDDDNRPASTAAKDKLAVSQRLAVAIPCLLIILAAEIGSTLISTPFSQIAEGIICRRFYPDDGGGGGEPSRDPRCKNHDVQSELSTLQGWDVTFGLIPGLLTAVPYGVLADRHGRKLVLCLAVVGLILVQVTDVIIFANPHVFHHRLIWLSAFWIFVGGGPYVYVAMLFTMANDVSTETQRSTTFFYLAGATIAGGLTSGPLTYAAMTRAGAWNSVFIGIACLAAAALLAFTIPETRQPRVAKPDLPRPDDAECQHPSPKRLVHGAGIAAASVRRLFWHNKTLGLLLLSLLFTTLGKYVSIVLMQYTTQRFGWSWSEAGLLSSVSAAVNLALVAVILPAASHLLLTRLGFTPLTRDALLVRTGIACLVLGCFIIGLAASSGLLVLGVVVYALGSGYAPAMRGLLVLVAGDDDVGTLFTAISVLENAGTLISGPMMAAAFSAGLQWGQSWTGLPFLAAGCLMCVAAVIVFGVGTKDAQAASREAILENEEESVSR